MEKNNKSFKREFIKQNTLGKEIFRIDFYTLNHFEIVLENLEQLFNDNNYSYKQTNNYNINFELDDPEPLITQSFMLKKNVEVIQNYEFSSDDDSCKFIFNQNMLIFDKSNFIGYEGIERYFELFLKAIKIIFEESEVKFSRIGIRKINELILKDKNGILKYFDKKYLKDIEEYNDNSKELVCEYSFRPFYENDLSMNKNFRIVKGKYKNVEENVTAYSFMWDIDCYQRFNSDDTTIEQLEQICKKINENIFCEYGSIISNELYNVLKSEEKPEDIYGGIKNGAN